MSALIVNDAFPGAAVVAEISPDAALLLLPRTVMTRYR
jgi:hypothetical protein